MNQHQINAITNATHVLYNRSPMRHETDPWELLDAMSAELRGYQQDIAELEQRVEELECDLEDVQAELRHE